MKNCSQCNGSGIINKYSHIENGKCFKCNGTGKVEINVTFINTNDQAKTQTEINKVTELIKLQQIKLDQISPKVLDAASEIIKEPAKVNNYKELFNQNSLINGELERLNNWLNALTKELAN